MQTDSRPTRGNKLGQRVMTGRPGFKAAFGQNPSHKQRLAAAVGLLLGFCLQCLDLHAALLFRSLDQVNGRQLWSPVRAYGNPADATAARNTDGAPREVRVFLSGEITPADLDSALVMEGLLKSGKQRIAGNTVWFSSNGGDIDAGMAIGRLLRRLGVFTLIGRNDQCLSACVFAFMGGQRRSVAGRLGIHRPYFPFTDASNRDTRFRHLQKTLKRFFEEMDFPDSLYEAVMLVPPESMQFVASADLKRFYLEGISPSTEDMVDAAAARRRNLSMYEYLKEKARMPACAFFDAGEGRCEGTVQAAAVTGGAEDEPARFQASEVAPPDRANADPSSRRTRTRTPPETGSRDPT